MSSIGVITMYRRNYGAFLQAYALQKALIKCGYTAELIRYDYYRDKSILEVPLSELKKPLLFSKKILVALYRSKSRKDRRKVFDESIRKHLKESKEYYRSYNKLTASPPDYDIYLTGSDQVFNPLLTPHAYRSRLLCFTDKKKVSYAASAGSAKLNEQELDFLICELKKFTSISVRERKLENVICNRLNTSVETHIDPTLLLSADEWKQFASFPADLIPQKSQYIFFYQVGDDNGLQQAAEELSNDTGLPIFAADRYPNFKNVIERNRVLSPEEWVGALLKADFVVTNSFHGTVFSIIFHRKTHIVFPTHNYERIAELLRNTNLMNLTNGNIEYSDNLFANADYYINIERDKSMDYLQGIGE